MNVSLLSDQCVGAGQCVLSAPEVFDQDETSGVVVLLDPAPGPGVRAAAYEAADLCPARAILVSDGDGDGDGDSDASHSHGHESAGPAGGEAS